MFNVTDTFPTWTLYFCVLQILTKERGCCFLDFIVHVQYSIIHVRGNSQTYKTQYVVVTLYEKAMRSGHQYKPRCSLLTTINSRYASLKLKDNITQLFLH